ncbi:MAG: hypothetical protein PHD48_12740 [Alphaproteobacteria bacterium]|nr:hypothetical protein [Alphaproteobacteria bacterium]
MTEEIFVRFARKPYRFDEVISAARDTDDLGSRVVISETIELTTDEYDAFANAPLRDRAWLAGKGGYFDLKRQVVEVTAPERQTLYVDPSGSSYGRYVGLRVPTPSCRYPEVRVYLSGRDGNAFSILGRCQRAARKAYLPDNAIKDFISEAKNGDYNHLLATCMRWFDCV